MFVAKSIREFYESSRDLLFLWGRVQPTESKLWGMSEENVF